MQYVLPLGLAAVVIVQYVACRRLARRYSLHLVEETGQRMEAEQHLAALVESMPAAIVVVDDQGRIRHSNNAAETLSAFSTAN